MNSKIAEPMAGTLGLLLSGALLGEIGRKAVSAVKSVPGSARKMYMNISKAPGNIDSLREYSDTMLRPDKVPGYAREQMLDTAIDETLRAVNAGKADMYTLAGLLREKNLISNPTSVTEDAMEVLRRLKREHPVATGVAGGVGGLGTLIGLNKLRNQED